MRSTREFFPGVFPRRWLAVAFVLVSGLLLAARAAGDEARFEVASGVRQLFLDDVEIDRLVNVELVVNEPQRHPRNPLLVPDTPWERGCQV